MKGYIHTITIKLQGHKIEQRGRGLHDELNHVIEQYVARHFATEPSRLSIQYDYELDEENARWLEHPLLTERQCKIVQLLIQHYSTKRIADQMYISENTVKKHIQNIKKSLNMTSSGHDFVFEMMREMERVHQLNTPNG
ncbi:response regulator transcription factor [Paenibacillus sp. GCM10027627]|uniref:response regulator transcription factor n=1 Tax=unclassified Paenibacillus TaxID=185978 RepID=UPI00363A2D07